MFVSRESPAAGHRLAGSGKGEVGCSACRCVLGSRGKGCENWHTAVQGAKAAYCLGDSVPAEGAASEFLAWRRTARAKWQVQVARLRSREPAVGCTVRCTIEFLIARKLPESLHLFPGEFPALFERARKTPATRPHHPAAGAAPLRPSSPRGSLSRLVHFPAANPRPGPPAQRACWPSCSRNAPARPKRMRRLRRRSA